MALSFVLAGALPASAAETTIEVFGHRYPFSEYYIEKTMPTLLPEVKVVPRISSYPQLREKVRITLSAGSNEIDILACQAATVRSFAKNGWLEPIDDLWEKYKDQYNLADIPENIVDGMRYEGKLYGVPFGLNTMMFFYRKDLFDEKGVTPPTTMAEYVKLAKMFHTPKRAGTMLALRMVETGINQTHWHFNAHGPGWLDENFKPIFNQPHGVEAIETMKELAKYSSPGYLSNGNNESMVLFQQGLTTMGLQWASRAKAMDDPKKSKFIGKVEFAAPPGGGSRVIVIGYCMPKFSDVDRELRFRLLMEANTRKIMTGGAAYAIPARSSVMGDPEVQKNNRHYKGVQATLKTAMDVPPLPEYSEVGEFMIRRIHQALNGELEVKEALDLAAKEAEDHLRKRGYYK